VEGPPVQSVARAGSLRRRTVLRAPAPRIRADQERSEKDHCSGHRLALRQRAEEGTEGVAMTSLAATPAEWLRAFEAAVRARDFAGGRTMFADDAVAFGTWARAVAGLDNIVREQWQNVWPRIRDFHFEPGVHIGTAGDTAWIAGSWLTEVTGP